MNRESIAEILGVTIGCLPFKYLGLPLSSVYAKTRHYSSLVDKFRGKIEGWQLNQLSFVGRAELIKGVLHNVLSYWMFTFRTPNTGMRELERLLSTFVCNDACMEQV